MPTPQTKLLRNVRIAYVTLVITGTAVAYFSHEWFLAGMTSIEVISSTDVFRLYILPARDYRILTVAVLLEFLY